MTTKTDVLNVALLACEQPPIAGPSDTASWVQRVNSRYAPVTRKLLERHPWNFATKRLQLQKLPDAPIGRDFAYNKPGDCLRILLVNTSGSTDDRGVPSYDDEAGQILTDLDPCYLIYVSSDWMNQEGAWPQVFADAVACEIAALCYGVFGKSATKKEEMKKDARRALQEAKSWDAAQKPHRQLPLGRWAGVRGGHRYPGYGGN